jgi:hypothetical protein
MQFQVPQFIETEDKIVGPLTLRQFLYVGGAAGLCFLLYFTVQLWLAVILSIFLLSISVTLAFIKVGGRPLIHVALSAFGFYWKPQVYVWQPEHPGTAKSEASMKPLAPAGLSLSDIVSGAALRNVWQNLQTGSKISDKQFLGKAEERYEVFQRQSGERQAARRVDYR